MQAGNIGSSKSVGELDLKTAIEVRPETTVYEACKAMTEKNTDSVIVVDTSGAFGAKPEALSRPDVVGIMTVKDVVNRVVGKGKDPAKTKVSEAMTSPVQTTETTATLYKVALLMNQNDFRQVPVVDKYKIRGIVTSRIINMSIIEGILEDIKLMVSIFR